MGWSSRRADLLPVRCVTACPLSTVVARPLTNNTIVGFFSSLCEGFKSKRGIKGNVMRTKKHAPVSQKSFEFLMFDRNAAHNDTRKHCQSIFQV